MTPTIHDVRDALGDLTSVEIEESDLSGGVRVALAEDETGKFFKAVRENDFDAQSKRIGDTLVAHIDADTKGLGELFG